MFNKHVIKQLSAYCHGALAPDETRRVAEHLLQCARCHKEYDEIKLGVKLAEQLPLVSAPAEMWSDIEALLDGQTRQPARQPQARTFLPAFGWVRLAAVSATLALLVTIGVIVYRNYGPHASWIVESLAGAPQIGGSRITPKDTRLAEGETLVTDATSRASLSIGKIGIVEIEPNSSVRLVRASITEHRLALNRGQMHAIIKAPPRIFFVDTPSAEAVDLGCEYTLKVDDAGRTFLHVIIGWVMLQRDGRESYVPRDGMCETRPGIGPGTPFFDDASDGLRAALEKYDFENGGTDALNVILNEARERDTFTLWHLIQRVDEPTRAIILERMIALVGLPQGVTREGLMRLNKKMLENWKDELVDTMWY
jgi:hypothetical protein